MKELHLYLFGEIGQNESIFSGEIFSAKWLITAMQNTPNVPIMLHINSPGGDVSEGFAMYDILTTSGRQITTIVEGRCASVATVVFLAGSVRKMTQNSTFFIHNPWQDGWVGDAEHFRSVADSLEAVEQIVANFYHEKTGLEVVQVLQYMKDETTFDAKLSQELGFATEVIETVSAKALLKNLNNNMSKTLTERLSAAMKAFKGAKNMDVATADGQTLVIDAAGAEPAVGDSVSVDGQPAADGEYKTADGKTIVVVAGKISDVKAVEAPAAAVAPAASEATVTLMTELVATVTELSKNFTTMQAQITKQRTEDAVVLEELTGAIELIGTSAMSAGFKKPVKRTTPGGEAVDTTSPAAQKNSAIEAVRKRRGLTPSTPEAE